MRNKITKLINLIHAYVDLFLAREKPQAYPVELSIGTTSYCNLKCVQCPREGNEGNLMPFDEHLDMFYYRRLEPLLERAKEVSLYGLGEPMIDRRYFDKVRYITSFGADVSLSSNGTLLDENRCRELIASGVKAIGISLDAATEQTYALVRPPGGFPTVIQNIKRLSRMKKELGANLPQLRLSMGIMPPNLQEITQFVDLAAELECTEIIVHPVIYMSREKREELHIPPDIIAPRVEQARHRAKELGVNFYYWDLDSMTYLKSLRYAKQQQDGRKDSETKPGTQTRKPHFCNFLWRNAMIQGRGELFPCCYITNVHLGYIDHHDLRGWRSHPFLEDLRRQLFEGDIPEPCARCPQLYPFDRSWILKQGYVEVKHFWKAPR